MIEGFLVNSCSSLKIIFCEVLKVCYWCICTCFCIMKKHQFYTLTWTWEWESATLATLKQVQIIVKMMKTEIREKCARHKRTSTKDSLGRFSDTSTDPRLCRQEKIVLHSHSKGFTASVTLHSVSLACKILNPILINLACKVLTPFLHTICNLVICKSVEAFKQITT